MNRVLFVALMLGCAGAGRGQGQPAAAAPKAGKAEATPPVGLATATKPFTGDFDAMVMRRLIRVLTPRSKTGFFVHSGVTRGLVYDLFKRYETDLN